MSRFFFIHMFKKPYVIYSFFLLRLATFGLQFLEKMCVLLNDIYDVYCAFFAKFVLLDETADVADFDIKQFRREVRFVLTEVDDHVMGDDNPDEWIDVSSSEVAWRNERNEFDKSKKSRPVKKCKKSYTLGKCGRPLPLPFTLGEIECKLSTMSGNVFQEGEFSML